MTHRNNEEEENLSKGETGTEERWGKRGRDEPEVKGREGE